MDNTKLSQEAINTAMKSPEHLKAWLEESGRRWIILDGIHLIDALPWPEGANAFTEIIMAYRDHRAVMPSGNFTIQHDDVTNSDIRVPAMKSEMLEVEEMDRVIRYMIRYLSKKDPNWDINNKPL